MQFIGARMAEWSKAPDLRSSVDRAIAMVKESGYSDLLVEAWVAICFDSFHVKKKESSLVLMSTCSSSHVQAVDATLLSQHLGVQIVDVFHKNIAHFHKFKITAHEIESFFITGNYTFAPDSMLDTLALLQ